MIKLIISDSKKLTQRQVIHLEVDGLVSSNTTIHTNYFIEVCNFLKNLQVFISKMMKYPKEHSSYTSVFQPIIYIFM
jgi:hypothetical protein